MKQFIIRKNAPSENEKLPTHSITAKIGEEWVNLGGCWVKQGAKGTFLSCQLSDAWVDTKDNTKSRKSYVIVAEEEVKVLKTLVGLEGEEVNENSF